MERVVARLARPVGQTPVVDADDRVADGTLGHASEVERDVALEERQGIEDEAVLQERKAPSQRTERRKSTRRALHTLFVTTC